MTARPARAPLPADSGTGHELGDHWDKAPVLYAAVDSERTLVFCNETEAAALGYGKGELRGAPLSMIYPKDSVRILGGYLDRASEELSAAQLHLQMRRRDRSLIDVSANLNFFRGEDGDLLMRLVKTRIDPALLRLEQARHENEILEGIVATARDACWCIEFAEPVDLTAPEEEIIRQVFENDRHWRFCNTAMARLYKLPEELDFNAQNVSLVFPRNPDNEAFVRQLIESDFEIDGAPSLDHRYDGAQVYAENDVRGRIENGRLLRMWGTVRNLSQQKRKERELADRVDAMLDVLSSAPDPILVVSVEGLVEAANPALEWCFGWPVDKALGRAIGELVRFEAGLERVLAMARPASSGPDLTAEVVCGDGEARPCVVRVAATSEDSGRKRIVLTLRPGRRQGAVV